ncbi:MAG: two-component system response regulator HydG [Planctomycetota bacterium]|jgi:two-component system response regulator HydG
MTRFPEVRIGESRRVSGTMDPWSVGVGRVRSVCDRASGERTVIDDGDPMNARLLLVDDDVHLLELIRLQLRGESLDVRTADSGASAMQALKEAQFDAVVLDLGLPDASGLDILERLRTTYVDTPVVILTAREDAESAVACLRAGATDFLSKPFDRARLIASVRGALTQGRLKREVSTLRKELKREGGFGSFLGTSAALGKSLDLLGRAASSEVTVLLEGESGTGKEIAARAIHAESDRATGRFLAINCGALPETLVESELFGHEKGSFTGADSLRRGCFEEANGGTLFLDEVGELKPEIQVRLLRVIQDRTVQRLGSNKEIPIDVRIVTATNRDLRKEVEAGRFREDLFYRLAVFPVVLPPLRDRDGDVELLAQAFLDKSARELGRPARGLSREALNALVSHTWPGNVRELINVLQRAVILEDSEVVHTDALPVALVENAFPEGASDVHGRSRPAVVHAPGYQPLSKAGEGLEFGGDVLRWVEYERAIVLHALESTDWSIKNTLALLGIGRATLYRKIERYGLRDEQGDGFPSDD